ncbi:MAG: histidine phosphatase family protein [Spirochaetaceae bacterium]
MTHICLVRHGETDWNYRQIVQGSTNIPLNSRGREQALETAGYLGEEKWDAIYSSPLSRAYETARIIGKETGFSSIPTDTRLEERHFGEAEGIPVADLQNFYRNKTIPGAESRDEVQRRAVEVLEDLQRKHAGGRIIAVAHGGLIASILSCFSNGEILPGEPPLKNSCMNLLSYDGKWRIVWYNRTAGEAQDTATVAEENRDTAAVAGKTRFPGV